jgi:hypothetical protein
MMMSDAVGLLCFGLLCFGLRLRLLWFAFAFALVCVCVCFGEGYFFLVFKKHFNFYKPYFILMM